MTDFLETVTIRKHKRRGRAIRIAVKRDGTVVLSLPRLVSVAAGKQFLLSKREWILEARKRVKKLPVPLLQQGSAEEYRLYKEQAREFITKRVEYFQKIYQVTYRKLSIRNQKTRFGSCSIQGNLSFTYQLLFLPEHLRDYVIVHELCHLKELNHSKKFWALVSQAIPDYQEKKRDLQAFSRTLS